MHCIAHIVTQYNFYTVEKTTVRNLIRLFGQVYFLNLLCWEKQRKAAKIHHKPSGQRENASEAQLASFKILFAAAFRAVAGSLYISRHYHSFILNEIKYVLQWAQIWTVRSIHASNTNNTDSKIEWGSELGIVRRALNRSILHFDVDLQWILTDPPMN